MPAWANSVIGIGVVLLALLLIYISNNRKWDNHKEDKNVRNSKRW